MREPFSELFFMPTAPPYDFALCTAGKSSGALCFVSLGTQWTDEPPPLFFAALFGTRENISSQIAVQMSIDAFIETALEVAEAPADPSLPVSSTIVREAFKEANARVYQYAHRMGAGGTMGAVGAAACYAGGRFTMARVGSFGGYLVRQRDCMPLFERDEKQSTAGTLTRFIGANAQVLVDLASLEVAAGDLVAFTSIPEIEKSADVLSLSADGEPLAARGTKVLEGVMRAKPELSGHPIILSLLELIRPIIVLREIVEE